MKTFSRALVISTTLLSMTAQSLPVFAQGLDTIRAPRTNAFFWPNRLDLSTLREHDVESNPYGADFDYAKEFQKLDLNAVKADINDVIKTSQDWWPADFGSYAPFFIRMAWHGAGTYRIADGRGGATGAQQRFEPLNSWPDNVNLDKARRLLWPVKKKYGRSLSWGDLMVLTGNCALESMGFKTIGYAGGRSDDWQSDLVYWGAGAKFMSDNHLKNGELEKPLAATQMGLIYVNPEGPNGVPDPLLAARDTREAFKRMAMDDAETVALIAGGHTFGKSHGAAPPKDHVGEAPAGCPIAMQGFGWANNYKTGKGPDAISSGLEGTWSSNPTNFTMQYLNNLFNLDWVATVGPGGAHQWTPKEPGKAKPVPDAFDSTKTHAPMMFTTDIALKMDPEYNKIAKRFQENPEEFKIAFARAWFKLVHRDMGPKSRYLGNEVPKEDFIWQDPVPAADYKQIDDADVTALKAKLLACGLSNHELISTAWASAASFRGTDKRGGANGARVRLAPQKDWKVNDPAELSKALKTLEGVQSDFNAQASGGKKVSLADVIVLGGTAAVEDAAKKGGFDLKVPFLPGRTDATLEQTDVESFDVLEPKADGFRNYFAADNKRSPTEMLVEKAEFLKLSVPEMTVLLGGMRALDANEGHSKLGVFTDRPGVLSNDFFVNLLDMSTEWNKTNDGTYEGKDRKSHQLKWTGTSVDLIFGSSSELRAVAEVYASDDARVKFAHDFARAWVKVMDNDRYDLKERK
jgi:catalase-peroxidase